MTHIQELRDVIHHLHGAKAKHLESVPVKESFQGQTVWDGIVEVFRLKGHPKTDRAYAWIHATDDPARPYSMAGPIGKNLQPSCSSPRPLLPRSKWIKSS